MCVAVSLLQQLNDVRQHVGGVSGPQQVQQNLLTVFVSEDLRQDGQQLLQEAEQRFSFVQEEQTRLERPTTRQTFVSTGKNIETNCRKRAEKRFLLFILFSKLLFCKVIFCFLAFFVILLFYQNKVKLNVNPVVPTEPSA